MSILGKILSPFRRKPEPKPVVESGPQLESHTHEFGVKDGQLTVTPNTLDEYYSKSEAREGAQNLFNAMTYAEQLKADDQTSLDVDDRPGHVVLPEEKFESHPESGYVHSSGDVHSRGDDKSAQTTQVKDSYRFKEQRADWDKENNNFRFSYQALPEPKWSKGPRKRSIVARGEFQVSEQGTVELPNITSLQEAEEKLPQRETAQRAGELIKAAQFWLETGQSLDQGSHDLNPDSQTVIAPGVPRETLEAKGLGEEKAISEAFEWVGEMGDEELPFYQFDVESRPNEVHVFGSDFHGGRAYGSNLRGELSDNSLKVVLDRPEHGSVEKAVWNFAKGTVRYRKTDKG